MVMDADTSKGVIQEERVYSDPFHQIRETEGHHTRVWDDESLSIAKSGFDAYRAVLSTVDESTRQALRQNPSLQHCFLGIAPVQHVTHFTEEQIAQLERAVPEADFLLLRYFIPMTKDQNKVLVNVRAAQRVMKEKGNADLFREGENSDVIKFLRTPKKYLANAPFAASDTVEKRHGVFSGFPRSAVDAWVDSMGWKAMMKRKQNPPEPIGSFDKEGFAFSASSPDDVEWFKECIALREASGIASL